VLKGFRQCDDKARLSDTLGRRLLQMHISWLSVGVVIAVLLSSKSIAGALEDCAAAYDRRDYAATVQLCRPLVHVRCTSDVRRGFLCNPRLIVRRFLVEA
jgi:hypothetical protein